MRSWSFFGTGRGGLGAGLSADIGAAPPAVVAFPDEAADLVAPGGLRMVVVITFT
jgi:hypothetical protein